MAKYGAEEDKKIVRVAIELQWSLIRAFGLMTYFWAYARKHCRDGSVSRADVADMLFKGGEITSLSPERFLQVMHPTDCEDADEYRLLDRLDDGRYYIHNWHLHAEDFVHRALARGGKLFANGEAPKTTRLTSKEREALAAQGAKECAQNGEMGARSAHGGRTKGARHAPPRARDQAKPSQAYKALAGHSLGNARDDASLGAPRRDASPERVDRNGWIWESAEWCEWIWGRCEVGRAVAYGRHPDHPGSQLGFEKTAADQPCPQPEMEDEYAKA